MSNELSVLLQNNPALVQTGLDDDTLAVAGGAGGGGDLGIHRGQRWQWRRGDDGYATGVDECLESEVIVEGDFAQCPTPHPRVR